MAERKKIDWEAIEREYRLGQKSLRQLSSEFGPSHGAISKRAKKYRWVKDQSQEIRQKTKAALLKETPKGNTQGNTQGNTPTLEDIERAVQTNIAVIRGHRKTLKTLNELISDIFSKLKALKDKDKDPKKDIRFHINSVKEISFAIKNLIPLERQAFNLDSTSGDDDAPDSIRITYHKES